MCDLCEECIAFLVAFSNKDCITNRENFFLKHYLYKYLRYNRKFLTTDWR